eukprot:NODE_5591_length_1754_cov_6.009219.p1 GENE.NODE_5591_length_1754_cov_6.009219~~NODE_5591_length_1754_cov_6.009219.p1  ORF type:complete len:509 (+),score=90.83 NODE_5591_length_1754_cov_6.009219:36-1529(+)
MVAASSSTVDLPPELQHALRAKVPGFLALNAARKLTYGASHEMYELRIVLEGSGGAPHQYCLRRRVRGQMAPNEPPLRVEPAILSTLATAGLVVPRVVAQLDDPAGEAYVMDWVDGETMGPRVCRLCERLQCGSRLAESCGEFLGDLQRVPTEELRKLLPTYDALDAVRGLVVTQPTGPASPTLDFLQRWLEHHAPVKGSSAAVLVHGDFRNGNIVVSEQSGSLRAVLDWEFCHLGEPMEDLAWLLSMPWRYGRPELQAGGVGGFGDVVRGFERRGGRVDHKALRWWTVYSSFKWAVIAHSMATQPTLEAVAIHRRASEGKLDALITILGSQALAPPCSRAGGHVGETTWGDHFMQFSGTTDGGGSGSSDGRGGTAALLHELQRGLSEEVRRAAPKGSRVEYLVQLATTVAGIAEREFRLGAAAAKREEEGARALLVESSGDGNAKAALSRAIRDRRFLADDVALGSYLLRCTVERLAFENPHYWGLRALSHPPAKL